jgi:hypothetical protein
VVCCGSCQVGCQRGSDHRLLREISRTRVVPRMNAQSTAPSVSGEQDVLTTFGIRSRCTFTSTQCGRRLLQYLSSSIVGVDRPPSGLPCLTNQSRIPYLSVQAIALAHTRVSPPLAQRNAHLSDEFAVEKSNCSRPLTTIFGQLQSLAVRECLESGARTLSMNNCVS